MNSEIKEILDYFKKYTIDETDETIYVLSIDSKEAKLLLDYITNLGQEKDKYKMRCYKSLKLIRDNYGLLDKYGVDMLDDILTGGDEE